MVHNEMLQNNLLVADALHNLEKQCAHTSDHNALKDVMEESRSNATKESMNEDNPLLDMVINVEYHSTVATKEQPQLDFVDQCGTLDSPQGYRRFIEHINKRDIDSGVMAQGFGYIVLTTSAGIMDHEEARRKNVGGKVLGNA
ncbi:ribosomal protein S8 [Artemisia annua]|uniref:Ribosomal protein S8 n=1 Tax=Artemisia annua TaxID=35608 RepID=A0A2U1NDM9_ARTAN|nr:ribosomal protein S8 [Artemisia annua]